MPEITDLLNMEFEDPELEPVIVPLDARLSLRGSSEELRTLFERLTTVSPVKEKIPGTSLVHIAADDGVVTLTATDGAQALVLKSSSIRINREGKALLPGHKLKSIFSLCPDPISTLTILSDTATVVSGRAVWTIAITPGDKLHAVPDFSEVEMILTPRRALHKALSVVKKALPTFGGRKSLEQVNLVNGSVTASDGYRMIRQSVEGLSDKLSFAIPKDTVDELIRALAAGSEEQVYLGSNDSLIVFQNGGDTLVSRRLSVGYPDLESQFISPSLENQYNLTVNTHELRDAVKRIRVSSDPEYASVTLHFEKKKKDNNWELTVLTRDRTGNSASESMFVMWEGDAEPFDIVLNHKYLTEMLEAYNTRLAVIRVGSGTKTRALPLLLQDKERGFTAVVQQSVSR